jgi:hypothetical protein
MFGSRRGRPSLIGGIARSAAQTAGRTAVVVGTANAMSRPRSAAPAPAEAPPAAAPAPAAGLSEAAIAKLQQLADLKTAGVLTAAEFDAQKALILNG